MLMYKWRILDHFITRFNRLMCLLYKPSAQTDICTLLMGGFADDKNTESVIIVFFPPFFCLQISGRKSQTRLSDLNMLIDVVWTSSLLGQEKNKTCSSEEVDPRYYPWNLVYDHSTKFRGHGVKALEFCSLLSFSVLILVRTDPFFRVADAASMLLKPRLLRPQPAWDDDGR